MGADAAEFVGKLLVADPDTRLTAQQALEHKWFQSMPATALPASKERIKDFNGKRKLKRGVLGVMSARKISNSKLLGALSSK